jgi:hypothetical protein
VTPPGAAFTETLHSKLKSRQLIEKFQKNIKKNYFFSYYKFQDLIELFGVFQILPKHSELFENHVES